MTPSSKSYDTTVQRFVIQIQKPAKYFVFICITLFLTSQGVSYGHDVNPPGHNHIPYFVDEHGEDIIASPGIFVSENLSNHFIGNVTAIDEDADDTLTYSLDYDAMYYGFPPGHKYHNHPYGHYYTINSETGEVRTGSNGLDFEALPYTYHYPYKYHTVVVTVEDGNGGSATFVYQILVVDVYEPSDPTVPNDLNEIQGATLPSIPDNLLLSRDNINKQRTVRRSSRIPQDRVLFNEIRNAENDKNDWIELKNISDEPVSLKDWEISIVTPSEVRIVNKAEEAGKDEDIVAFPDYTLPSRGILLIVNTDPSETQLESGQDITDSEHNPDEPPQYFIAQEMRLPDTPYLLILRSVRDKNGKPEAFEDIAGNYFQSSVYYSTQVWPLMHTSQPIAGTEALLTQGEAWQRTDADAPGYTQAAWTSSGHQSGIGYKSDAAVETSLGTPGYPNDTIADEELVGRITISEVMFSTNGGLFSQSQWIELYNNTPHAAMPLSLKGWKLAIEARDSEVSYRYSVIELKELYIATNRTVLLVTRNQRNSGNLPENRIYDLYQHHNDNRRLGLHENDVLGRQGFGLKLYSPDGTLVDTAGNLDGSRGRDTPKWELPSGRTEDGARTSLIRSYQNNIALVGTEAMNWKRAADMQLTVSRYYGHKTDISTPGYREGGPVPITLSHFRADWTDTGVILKWITASETDNAGFNILRSQTKDRAFVKVNPTLILGAGTTAEQNTYTWTDTTAKPNVAYYYRIEDVSLDGNRQMSVTVRMRSHLSASGKSLQKWGDLKKQE